MRTDYRKRGKSGFLNWGSVRYLCIADVSCTVDAVNMSPVWRSSSSLGVGGEAMDSSGFGQRQSTLRQLKMSIVKTFFHDGQGKLKPFCQT